MEMESPVFELKEEPASPSWELELLDEVGGIWEGDVEVVDEVELEDVFWGQQDISELIGKEEQILGLELDEIALDLDKEDDIDLKEGSRGSFYPPQYNSCGTGTVISSAAKNPLTCGPKSRSFDFPPLLCDSNHQISSPESLNLNSMYPLTLHHENLILDPKSLIKNIQSPSPESLIVDPELFIKNRPASTPCPKSPCPNDLLPNSNHSSLTPDDKFTSSYCESFSFQNSKFFTAHHKSLTPCPKSFIHAPELLDKKCSNQGICTDPNCVESVCTDVSCCQNVCSELFCPGNTFQNCPIPQNSFSLTYQQWGQLSADDSVPNLAQDSNIEPYSNWLDSGAIYDGTNSTVSGLPTYQPGLWTAPESPADDKASVFSQGGPAVPTDSMQTAPADLLREFEDVLTQAAGSLTPPDSPRSANGSNVLLPLPASHIHSLPLSPPANPGFIILQDMANSPVVNDELDELVAETYQKNGGGIGSTAKTEPTFQVKSGRQQPWDSPTSSSGSCDSGYEDPDWSPVKSAESSVPSSDNPQPTKKLRLTSTEERRMRKKEQNKNAATRYRMKKKMEMEEIIGEEKELMDRHDSLKSEVVEITREIKYLKGLMGDLFRAKGLIRAK